MEGFLSKIPEPEVEEKRGLTSEELELIMEKTYKNIHHEHEHYKVPTDLFKPKGANAKARAKRKMADKSRRRNRR